MKKMLALLLAAAMLLSMVGCGGAVEPAQTTAVATEAPTEATTETPTEAPTEAPRVAPVDFEPVDPATLPEPVPVEEQLLSEDTQTVTLGSLEEYEDLLWELGFKEVRLVGTHIALVRVDESGKCEDAESYCEPVSLTYNENAFRFDFTYCQQIPDGEVIKEDGWCMYGTKSASMGNVSQVTDADYTQGGGVAIKTIELDPGETIQDGESASGVIDFESIDWESVMNNQNATESGGKITTPEYEEETLNFIPKNDASARVNVKAVYYPITGNLYNYMCDLDGEGMITTGINIDTSYGFQSTSSSKVIGFAATKMCFHYLFPAEETAD